ncbi:MAG TPA: T9SS type A sorting domain-containing protein [Chitinophagales bacterium]|nr:T9SS type A sorting domain-containing protein [Chitinophagales bacterium]
MKTLIQNTKAYCILASLFIIVVFSQYTSAQNPLLKQWDYSYGGYDGDFIYELLATSDSGFIAAGESLSNALFEKSENNWDQSMFPTYDFWVIKCDADGNKLWDKTLGGSDDDFLYNIISTADGGCMVAGRTRSPADGNISQAPIGVFDVWAVKLDAAGIIEWEHRYGGDGNNGVSTVLELADGGFLFGGDTDSPVSGDVSEPSYGYNDFWIFRTDALGNILWDKRYGGSDEEGLSEIFQTGDGGFLLAGASLSNISGLKTQNTYVNGMSDMWFVKIDSLGNFIWDKQLGSLDNEYGMDMIKTSDDHYLLALSSEAGVGADKTHPTNGITDFWMLKTDTLLNIIWDISIGGTGHEDDFGNIYENANGEYMISGTSYSGTGFWKSEDNNGPENTWIVLVNANGNKLWDKTILTGYTHTETGMGIQLKGGCYLFANDGDGFTAQEKTDMSYSFDYWCIKYCDTTNASQAPSVNFSAMQQEICQKFCTGFIDSSTNNPTSWLWIFPGGSPSSSTDQNPAGICYNSAGTFDVTLITTNANGSETLTLTNYITVHPTPPFPTITQNGNVLTCSPATGYQWQLDAVNIPGANNQTYTATQTGTYMVIISDANGCINNLSIYVEMVGIESVPGNEIISVYPNPVSDVLNIELKNVHDKDISIEIYSAIGHETYSSVEENISGDYINSIPLNTRPKGVYFLHLKINDRLIIEKVILE